MWGDLRIGAIGHQLPRLAGVCAPRPPAGSRTPTAALGAVGDTIAAFRGHGQRGGPGTQLSPPAFSPPPRRSADFASFVHFPTCSYHAPEPVSQADAPGCRAPAGFRLAPGQPDFPLLHPLVVGCRGQISTGESSAVNPGIPQRGSREAKLLAGRSPAPKSATKITASHRLRAPDTAANAGATVP